MKWWYDMSLIWYNMRMIWWYNMRMIWCCKRGQCVCGRMVQSSENQSLIHRPLTLSEDVDHNTHLWLLSPAYITPSSSRVVNPLNPWIYPPALKLVDISFEFGRVFSMPSEDSKGGKLPPHPFTVMPATPNIWMPHPPNLYTTTRLYYIPPTQTCNNPAALSGRNLLGI